MPFENNHPGEPADNREPIDEAHYVEGDAAETDYPAVHADEPAEPAHDIDDGDIEGYLAGHEKAERAALVKRATDAALAITEDNTAGSRRPDDVYSFWATQAEDPEIAAKITDPDIRARALGEIAKYTGNTETAALAVQTANSIEDPRRRGRSLTNVAISLNSARPLDNIEDNRERDYLLGHVAGATGNMDILDEVADPYYRKQALVDIAVNTGNPIAVEMIDDARTRDLAYLKMVEKTGDTSLVEKIGDKGLQESARWAIEDKAEEIPRTTEWDRIEQQQLADLVPVEHVTEIDDLQTRMEQCIVHLKHGQYDEETRATLMLTALDLIRQINPAQSDIQDIYYGRLSKAAKDPGPLYEAMENALADGNANRQYHRLIGILANIREIERGQAK